MIFEIAPSQVERLDSKQLVELLRKLLYAEVQLSGISLRTVSVPLQITIADGGEDARVHWSDGKNETDYLPCRFNIIQSKATDPQPVGWKKEVWTKGSQKDDAPRVLNDAVKAAIAERGAYIGFTSTAIVGNKMTRRIDAIKAGIRDAGEDPAKLATIQIYDANHIAAWVCRHPGVAVWVNEEQKRISFGGFQTIESWGGRADFSAIKSVEDMAARYCVGVGVGAVDDSRTDNMLTSQQARQRILEHLVEPKRCVRVVGPSGVGKSRFVYDLISNTTTFEGSVFEVSAIYCDFRSVGQARLHQAVEEMAREAVPVLIIVDECPRESALALASISSDSKSRLRLITIDIDDRPLSTDNSLDILMSKGDDELVEAIIRQRDPRADSTTISYLKNLCDGFPRIAVLATDNHLGGMPALKSIEDVVERVVSGCGLDGRDQLRAIECLAMFERVGVDGAVASHLDLVAHGLARQSGDEMYEHLASASKHELVDRRGGYFRPQPRPIAAFLGARRIDLLRSETILKFIDSAPDDLLISFLRQWRYFDRTRTAVLVAEILLGRNGRFGTLDALNSDFGAECLDALTHVAPDAAGTTVRRIFEDLSLEELRNFDAGRHSLVRVLERLAFRRESFHWAARLLLRLAAVETASSSNNATSKFKQLFQLLLSGTEAEPSERFAVIDDAITTSDERIVTICVEALETSLKHTFLSRVAGSEELGSQPPRRDWVAQTWDQLFEFRRRALATLQRIQAKFKSFENQYDEILADNLRALVCEPLIDDIEQAVAVVMQRRRLWFEGLQALGQWLYFDRKGSPEKLQHRVRRLYEGLMPNDPVDLALLYTTFWKGEIHDADIDYTPDNIESETFEYSTDKAVTLAASIAHDEALVSRAIRAMAPRQLHNIYPFAAELARNVADPKASFELALNLIVDSRNLEGLEFLRGFLAGIDERDSAVADECIEKALAQKALNASAINIRTAVKMSPVRLLETVDSVRRGDLAPAHCVYLSYGRGLSHLSSEQILPLIDELSGGHKAIGAWSALKIISMYQLGRQIFEADLLDRTVRILESATLITEIMQMDVDGHVFESLIHSIDKHGRLTSDFASKLGELFVRLCQSNNPEILTALDDYVRKVVKLLVSRHPAAFWEVISRFVERATPSERSRLTRIVSPSRQSFLLDDKINVGSGPMFGAPMQLYFDWADRDPSNRAPFLVEFFPLTEKGEAGRVCWHPALQTLADQYGSEATFRQALGNRLLPAFWSAAPVNSLDVLFEALESWYQHRHPELSRWARETHRDLNYRLKLESKLEDEDF